MKRDTPAEGAPCAHLAAELVGEHATMQELRSTMARVAASPVGVVMLYGESGSGKSLVSRLIHRLSERHRGPFIDVNCAAIAPTLVESELFGHEKGSFTGAVGRKTGLIEAAHRGTLFLDEVSELDLVQQAKLLGFLDTRSLRRVGGIEQVEVDARVVAATNRMLLTEVAKGRFREDLFYRLQLVFIRIPPLRDRGDDVFLLTEHYLRILGARYGRVIGGMEGAVREVLRTYPWPGNVRELAHLLERIFILSEDRRIEMRHLPSRMTDPRFWAVEGRANVLRARTGDATPGSAAASDRAHDPAAPEHDAMPTDFDAATAAFQRRMIRAALRHSDGQLARAAAALGLTRHALRHRMIRLGVRPGRGE